jgi:hypothetical protein
MLKRVSIPAILIAACCSLLAVEERHGFFEGVVQKMDEGAKTVVVKLADGTEHTLHFVKKTAVRGGEDVASGTTTGAKDTFHGLKEGTEVAVHYTAKGSEETADEFNRIGKSGMKASEVTVTKIDRGAKTLSVKAADGTVETYKMTDQAAKDAGKGVAEGAEKSAKVTVYYTEEAGHKVAHFFKGN